MSGSALVGDAGAELPRGELPRGEPPQGELPRGEPPRGELPRLVAARDAPLGGQAVLEGVMMRGVGNWAVAVRAPILGADPERDRSDGAIQVSCFPLDSALRAHRWLRLPVLRGVVALWGSLAIGFKALGISANAQLPEDERFEAEGPAKGDGISGLMWAGTVLAGLAFAIGLFFLLPLGLTSLLDGQRRSSVLFWIIEGVLRTAILLAYLLLLSRVRDLRRVFEYHGAEHKTISCFEAGMPLTPENAQRFSRLHPRCGTSFLLVVMLVSIFVFGAVGMHAWYLLVLSRILLVPLIVGVSFEIIKLAGKHRRHAWVRAVMWPGLKLQLLTTREPDASQLAVAIAALEAVLEREDLRELTAVDLIGAEVVA